MAKAKKTDGNGNQLPRLNSGDTKCPECNVDLKVNQTKKVGSVMAVYYECPVCETRYRGDRPATESEKKENGLLHCPECKGKCKPHGRRQLGPVLQDVVLCRHCGLNFRVDVKVNAAITGERSESE